MLNVKMKKKQDPLKIIGMIIIIISAIILFCAFPLVQQTAIKFGQVEITDISPISATRIFIGIVGTILGLIVYHGKNGLKILQRK